MLEKEVVQNILKPLVQAGVYKDETSALKDIILDYIERKKKEYDAIIFSFQKKYKTNFDAFTDDLRNRASIGTEDDWMEWKGAIEMRNGWEDAYQISIHAKTV